MNQQNKQRIFVQTFNKYLDELTVAEWEEAVNLNCGLGDQRNPNC